MDFTTPQAALILLALLAVKHFICDGPLQTLAMVRGKATYGNRLGLLHAAVHAFATLLVLFLIGLPPALALGIAASELVVHYHIDFAKEQLLRQMQWTHAQPHFWWTLVGDQALHHLSYIAAVLFIVSK